MVDNAFCMEPNERLKLARERKFPDLNATEVARRLGVKEPTYLGHENGSRGFQREAKRYARAFGVNLLWLRDGAGPMVSGQADPLLEMIEDLDEQGRLKALAYIEGLRARQGG